MEILYIILCIPLYVLNSFCDKFISMQKGKAVNPIYNIFKFAIGSIILLPAFIGDSFKWELGVIVCGVLCGVMYAISKMIILTGYEKTSVAFMTLCHASGLLMPCIAAHFLWDEKMTLLSFVGIILIVASIFFLKGGSGEGKVNLWGVLIGLVVLLTSGGVMILQKVMGRVYLGNGNSAYNFYSFVSAFLLLLPFAKRGQVGEKLKKILPCSVGSAVSLCVISLVMTFLAGKVPSYVMFPLFNGVGILAVTGLSAIVFKEKLTKKRVAGIALGLVGLFILNI